MYSPTFIPAARSVRTTRKHGAAAEKIGFQVKKASSSPVATISPPPGADHQFYSPSAGSYQNLYPSVLPPASIIIPHSAAPSTTPPTGSSSNNNPHINPSVVVIVVILSVVFILSGFLHLLARCLGRRLPASPPRHSPLVSALHGQLQHLFHLHDAGVEQAFIDTLPVFSYGSIRGLKDSADCAVCLTEFAEDDRLRLLPKCKHAFHLECIDTWLLSNSTCPLCRRSLLPDPTGAAGQSSSQQNELEDASESMHHSNRFIGLTLEEQMMRDSRRNISLHGSIHGSYQNSFRICEVEEVDDDESEDEIQVEVETPSPLVPTIRVVDANGSQRILKVELGKVSGKVKADSRKLTSARRGGRSYSMGSYEYVVDPSNLELMIAPTPYPGRPQDWAPSKPTHRSALSDSIPELASAGGTPANDDLFWASRGLYTPQTLSRVRELLTPSPGSNAFFSPAFPDYQYFADRGDRWIDINIERDSEMVDDEDEDEDEDGDEEDEDIEQQPDFDHSGNLERLRLSNHNNNIAASTLQDSMLDKENDFKQRSSSLSRLPEGVKVSVSYRRSLSETAGMEQAAAATCKDAAALNHGGGGTYYNSSEHTNSVKQAAGSSFSRRFSINWLMGRDKRMVFSAASPSNSSSDAATATATAAITSTHHMDAAADMRAIPV